MKVIDLIQILKKHNLDNEVVFYNLKNHNLTQYNLESIVDCSNQTEITTTKENVDE